MLKTKAKIKQKIRRLKVADITNRDTIKQLNTFITNERAFGINIPVAKVKPSNLKENPFAQAFKADIITEPKTNDKLYIDELFITRGGEFIVRIVGEGDNYFNMLCGDEPSFVLSFKIIHREVNFGKPRPIKSIQFWLDKVD